MYNCDGMLFYPGPGGTPCPSIRLENIRDGIEDWESFYMLRDYADTLRTGGPAAGSKAAGLLQQADAMLDVPDEVVKSVTEWSQDPELLLKTRRQLAELILAIKKLVPPEAYQQLCGARQAAQLRREREMLKQRAAGAATRPASQAAVEAR